MEQINVQYLGYVSAFLTTASFLPQVLQVLRSRDLSSISLLMYLMYVTGLALWLIYGFLLGSWPLVISNAITLLLSSIILVLKIRDDIRRNRRAYI